ncbi:MAG: response regulator transcription factor [Bacteroidia bacterium]|nr:response regulator transcription factor [Bacteroidia bacterium]
MKKIKLVLADDHKVFAQGLASLLEDENMKILGIAINGIELLELLKDVRPDIVLLDLRMPLMDGHEALGLIKRDYPSIKVIVLSMDYFDYVVTDVIINGASAFMKKGTDSDELLKVIREVYKEGFYFKDPISVSILERLAENKKLHYIIEDTKLSVREVEVLKEICKGLSQKEISTNLEIELSTFRYHKKQLMEKTGSASLVDLVKYAIRNRIANEND